MRLVPGQLYRLKQSTWMLSLKDEYGIIVPEGVLLMYYEQGDGKKYEEYSPTKQRAYYFLLGGDKVIFLKRHFEKLDEHFQSTEEWNKT